MAASAVNYTSKDILLFYYRSNKIVSKVVLLLAITMSAAFILGRSVSEFEQFIVHNVSLNFEKNPSNIF